MIIFCIQIVSIDVNRAILSFTVSIKSSKEATNAPLVLLHAENNFLQKGAEGAFYISSSVASTHKLCNATSLAAYLPVSSYYRAPYASQIVFR